MQTKLVGRLSQKEVMSCLGTTEKCTLAVVLFQKLHEYYSDRKNVLHVKHLACLSPLVLIYRPGNNATKDSAVMVSIQRGLFKSIRPCCCVLSLRFALGCLCVNVFLLNLMVIVVVSVELLSLESNG